MLIVCLAPPLFVIVCNHSAIAETSAPATPHAESNDNMQSSGYKPEIRNFKTFDEVVGSLTLAGLLETSGPKEAVLGAQMMRANYPDLAKCIRQRLSASEAKEVTQVAQVAAALAFAKYKGHSLDEEETRAVYSAVYRSSRIDESMQKFSDSALLYQINFKYCVDQDRIRKARGY